MVDGFSFAALGDKTPERKERGACGNKVKRKNNGNDEEAKQRFSKNSHGELGLFDPPPTVAGAP
jgi:hypothetical protein